MNREEEIKLIINELIKLKAVIETENKLNLTDKNIFLEDIMCQMINIIYEYALKNTNFSICNYPCIDLLDKERKVAVQVTTNISRDKIQNTLNSFFEKEYDKDITTIKFIVFINTSYRGDFEVQRDFAFDKEEDIITFDKLIAKINSLDDLKLKELYDFINISLMKNIYTTNWMIENTKKSLENLGKRYNKELNVYNEEEEKLEVFLIDESNKKKILKLIIDLIISIENNGVYTGINIDELINNFSFELIDKIKSELKKYKDEVLTKTRQYNEKLEFETEYINKIKKIEIFEQLFTQKTLIYTGEAGIGKSHTLANFIYKYYISKNIPAILLLGQDFVSSENVEIQFARNLNYQENLKTFCQYINNIAICKNITIPIIIDGINESKDKDIWKMGLINFIKTVTSFSNLKLILSLRDTYYQRCISEEIESIDKLKVIKHNGFAERSFEAAKEFFEFYNIPVPVTQLINREFSNPLFLNIYCEIVSKYEINIDEFKYDNFISIYDEYLRKVNELIVNKYEVYTDKNIIKECLNVIARDSIDNKFNSYEDALESVKEIAQLYDIKKTELLNELINNGILYKEGKKDGEILNFTYERYEKISKAEFLLSDINEVKELENEINDGILHDYFDHSDKFDQGVLEELLIIIPMKYKKDIFEIVDLEKISFKYYLDSAYIQSLIWLKDYYNVDVIVNNLNRLVKEDYREHIIDLLIKCSYIYTNPCNVNMIHNYLLKMSMPELDYKWTIVIENYYDNFTSNTIDNLINYSLTYGNEFLDDNTIYLISNILSWFLSSNNRGLRDKATKSLAKILLNKSHISSKLITEFKDVKDIYILERIIAAIYGAVIRSKDNNGIEELATKLYEVIYKGNNKIDNIIIKIYGKQLFNYLKRNFQINLYDQIDKEKKSEWYEKLPTNEEIDKNYSFDLDEYSKDNSKYGNLRIIHSMVTEYGRGTGGYGDFGRYTLQPMLWAFEYKFKDIQLLANVATKRIFEYGYDFKLFGEYDNSIKMNEMRNINYIERIGKKYQWIATYELLSKLYDNYVPQYDVYTDTIINLDERKYFDKNHIETKDKDKIEYVEYLLEEEYPHVLYIDTTNFILKQNNDNEYLPESKFDFEEEEYSKHIVKNFNGQKYVSLFNLHAMENRKIIAKSVNRKAITISQTAFIYKDKEKVKKSDFHKFSQGTYMELFNINLFDIPFSEKYLLENSYRQENYDINNGYKVCYQEYIWEKYQDESIEDTIKILLPAKWIVEEFELVQKSEGKWYRDEDLVCFDSSIDNLGTGIWIRYDYLIKYLNTNNLKIGWTIYLEKTSNRKYRNWRSDVFANEDISDFEVENYDNDEWESKFSI